MENYNNLNLNVMMLGGRRCGKTTVLAEMQDCFERKFGKGNLTIKAANNKTLGTLEEKRREIEDYTHISKRTFIPDAIPTEDKREYKFHIGIKGKDNGQLSVNFIDYPGEWLDPQRCELDMISENIEKSSIILITIDTPHLMEETVSNDIESIGIYNETINGSRLISDQLKNNFSVGEGNEKLILFIPLKCEKYYKENRMNEVSAKIKKAYEPLLNYFSGENAKWCEIAITPVITLSCAEFDHFVRDADGEIILHDKINAPKKAQYIFLNSIEFKPQYCEQPMVYVLMYLFEMAKRQKERQKQKTKNILLKGIIALLDKFLKMPTSDDFFNEYNNVKQELEKDRKAGYEFLNDPLKFNR